MLEKLKMLALRREDLETQLEEPGIYGDAEKLRAINRELKEYSPQLAERPQIVAAHKCDLLGEDREPIEKLKAHVAALGYEFFEMSAATTSGTRELIGRAANLLNDLPPITVFEPDYVAPEPVLGTPENLIIEQNEDVWFVEGPWLDRLVSSVNFGDHESIIYFDRMLRDNGVYERMEKLGAKDGDTVSICGMEFEYTD